jgi:uncharacterized protein (UPF0276 family)
MRARPINPHALGLGLRPELYAPLKARLSQEGPHLIGFLEIIAENFLGPAPLPLKHLDELSALIPITLHSVSLNLCGADPLNPTLLASLRALASRVRAPYLTDHLCWTSLAPVHHHDLLPPPYERDLLPYVTARAQIIQETLGLPFGIENISAYATWSPQHPTEPPLSEWDFYHHLVQDSNTHYMLDLNNLYVSSQNLQFDPEEYLAHLDWTRVLQVHIAGHQTHPNGLLHDTHDRPVSDPVWTLYRQAWRRGGPFPTLLEWDNDLPPLEALEDLLAHAHNTRGAPP